MPKVNIRAVLLLILTLLAIGVAVLKFVGAAQSKPQIHVELGTPLIGTERSYKNMSSITQIMADQKHIFVVYGYDSVVEVYALDGIYQYSIAVYNHQNGRTEIAANEGTLYICDKIHNVYLFSGHDYLEFIDRSNSRELRSKLALGKNSTEYVARLGSIWCYPTDGDPYCVIKRPVLNALYQNNHLDIFLLIIIIIIGIALRFPGIIKGRRS